MKDATVGPKADPTLDVDSRFAPQAEESVELRESFPTEAPDTPDAPDAPDGPTDLNILAGEQQMAVAVDQVEALLFSTAHPLTAARLADVLGWPDSRPIRVAVRRLNTAYAETGRCFRIEQVAGGYQMLSLPDYGSLLAKLHHREADTKLTTAAQETLAIIAYKQPVLRSDIEAIRGVGCGEMIRSLMEKRLVKIAGRSELPGRPILYGTTRRFLEVFGLNSVKDLPQPGK